MLGAALLSLSSCAWTPHTAARAGAPSVHTSIHIHRVTALRASTPPQPAFAQPPADVGALLLQARELSSLEASALTVAQLTDAIDYPLEDTSTQDVAAAVLRHSALFLKRQRRSQLLVDMLKADRSAYVETVSFLNIPRKELPNRQDVPLRSFDPEPRRPTPTPPADAAGADEPDLVADCPLVDQPMGENVAEAAILEVTRGIYATEARIPRAAQPGIRGLIEEMRSYMLSADGSSAQAQREVLLRTLRTLMTPVLPPFYRIFMGGLVPRHDPADTRVGADPKWLADGFAWVRERLPAGKSLLEPGKQLGPWFYAPALTAVVSPFAFGFLVGPATLNRRADGELGGLVVEKCKFLQESNCKGMCLNSCKVPAQELFHELGLDLRVTPNFETQECQWSFGEAAPPAADDPTWPKGCLVGCTSRREMKELASARGAPSATVAACE
jgi:hypothetical protein